MKLLQLCLIALLFFSCKKQDTSPNNNGGNNNNPPTPQPKGIIAGRVVAANNTTPVRNATVFIADSANIFSTTTDINGNFSLQAPAGIKYLNIQSGSGKIFRTTMLVSIEADKTTTISTAVKLNQVASLAYVYGTYDKIQSILVDSLGYTATMIMANDLHYSNIVNQYNAIFINCSSNIQVDYVQDSVLANYVANGGSLYVSDYAVAALIGAWNNSSCPVPRMYGFIPESKLCTSRYGLVTTYTGMSIVSPSLQVYLNKNTMDVKYDLTNWEMVQNYDTSFWEVLVKHPGLQSPLLLRTSNFTNSSAGTIPIGSTANTNYTTICHKPVGSTSITITIPTSSLAMHLAHGDSMGSCQSMNGSGRIYFTTFHTEPNGLISPDMKHILDYIILNL